MDTITVFSGDSERGKGDKIRLNDQGHAIPTGGVESHLMTSDRPHESAQDAGGSAHVTPSSTNSSSNPLDTVFSFSLLEGKDAGQQVRQYNKWCRVPNEYVYSWPFSTI